MTFRLNIPSLFSLPFCDKAAHCILWLLVSLCAASLSVESIFAQGTDKQEQEATRQARIEMFEQQVRPVLMEQCGGCHGAKKQESSLRVDSLASLLEGGDSGPAIVPGVPEQSLLLQAIRHEHDLEMPPDKKLADHQIAAIEQWVGAGAIWPADNKGTTTIVDAASAHWAFQPVRAVALPPLNDDWIRNPVDAFVLRKLHENGLQPAAAADRYNLIRRVSYTLTGLPPSAAQAAKFVISTDPQAYEQLVDSLLESPAYGEHWGRHWLDIARYADTKGYVYAREERFWTHAATYRDWVVQALNDDLPYDRFLLLQLAADQVADCSPRDLAAMGFLTLGRRFLGVRRDVIDDRIDVLARGTMALTVNCARCHDHKYDPIPTADYYSLYGVFDSCFEQQQVISDNAGDEPFRTELHQRQAALQNKFAEHIAASSARMRRRAGDYLFAQSELHKYPAEGFDQIFQKDDLLPEVVRSWSRFLRAAEASEDPIFSIWQAGLQLSAEELADRLADLMAGYRAQGTANTLVLEALQPPPQTFRELCDRYGQLFIDVDQQWQTMLAAAAAANLPAPSALPDANAEAVRQVMYEAVLHGVPGPCRIPAGPISQSELYFDSDALTELWKLQGEVDRWLNSGPANLQVALILRDQATPIEPRIFRRGDPLKLGDDVPRRFLSLFRESSEAAFQTGSGRLELAQAIIDSKNPLTARVIVNRVWAYHFSRGLVSTPSDFGLRCDPPSHPELLDWLTTQFIESGWSLKQLHRWLLLSATYRQSSAQPADDQHLKHALRVDPENRWLWRMNPRRLAFEELRDSMLQVTNSIDRQMGGRATDLFSTPYSQRRTVYGLVDRQFFASTLRVFDLASPDLHVAERNETTVPQQALFFLNHPLVLERARVLAEQTRRDNPRHGIAQLFEQVFQREPEPDELAAALELLEQTPFKPNEAKSTTAKDWSYGYGTLNAPQQKLTDFVALPYFSGHAWQGGSAFPDLALGWTQLTASGGHPGNSRSFACVRRWTAPADMDIAVQSTWQHQPEAGDGIRIFIASSSAGLLHSAKLHHDEVKLNVDSFSIKAGDTVDFVVDINEVLNSDQFLCSIVIEPKSSGSPAQTTVSWNAEVDFSHNAVSQLDAWEQLAHVLLCTNEFSFVD